MDPSLSRKSSDPGSYRNHSSNPLALEQKTQLEGEPLEDFHFGNLEGFRPFNLEDYLNLNENRPDDDYTLPNGGNPRGDPRAGGESTPQLPPAGRAQRPRATRAISSQNNVLGTFACNEPTCGCGQSFTSSAQLGRHVAHHMRKFECNRETPPSIFGTLNDLERHFVDVHHQNIDGSPATPYYCPRPDCDRNSRPFWRETNRDAHVVKRHRNNGMGLHSHVTAPAPTRARPPVPQLPPFLFTPAPRLPDDLGAVANDQLPPNDNEDGDQPTQVLKQRLSELERKVVSARQEVENAQLEYEAFRAALEAWENTGGSGAKRLRLS